MFFRRGKGKESKEFSRLEERMGLEMRFHEAMQEVGRAVGADQKILLLEKLKEEIDGKIAQKVTDATKAAQKKGKLAQLGGHGAGLAGLTGVTIVTGGTAFPLSVAAYVAGLIGGEILSIKTMDSTQKHFAEEQMDIVGLMRQQRRDVASAESQVLASHLEEIARSPMRNRLFKDYPEFREDFAAIAARKIAEEDAPAKPAAGKKSSPKSQPSP
jgi:hypothetical protein